MARRERLVTCPHCDHERPTRAAGGMRLKCPACGGGYRAPSSSADDLPVASIAEHAPERAPAPQPPAAPDEGAVAGTSASSTSTSSSGVTVAKATATRVKAAPPPAPEPDPEAGTPTPVGGAPGAKGALGGRESARRRARALDRIGGRR